jgi:predicted nucleotidyltransferase
VFGSRAAGTARRYSDIDVGLAGEPLLFDQLGRLREALEDSELPYRVDVVNLAETSDQFRAVAPGHRDPAHRGIRALTSRFVDVPTV